MARHYEVSSRRDVTATTPIKLETYHAREALSRMVDDECLTDEWKAWYDARVGRWS